MNITEFAILKKMFGKGGGNASEVDAFVVTQGEVYSMSDVMREQGSNLSVRLVQTLPDNLIKSNFVDTVYLYIVESTGIGYADFGDAYGIVTAGQVAFLYADGYDKGWTTDIYSATEDGVYYVRKNSGANAVTETSVASSFDNTGDGIAEVYSFSKALPTRFTSGYGIQIDAVTDITDDNGVHQEAGSHYIKYDEVAAGTGTMPYAHVYCYDNSSANYLRYSFYVAEAGIYELAVHLRIKDEQLRGATYTINKGTGYEHAFVTTYGWASEKDALEIRNNDHLQGAYMSGMMVYLPAGFNTIHITNAAGVAKNQHFRNLYLVKVYDYPTGDPKPLTMDEAEAIGVGLAKGARLPDYYYIEVTFNNGAPRSTDGFCRVITSNGHKMSIQKIEIFDLSGQTMPLEGETVTLRCKLGCVNSSVNGSIGKEARIFGATII